MISTRRSWRSAGTGATRQSPSRTARVSSRKSGELSGEKPLLAFRTREEQLLPPVAELALERGDEVERLRREHSAFVRAVESDARSHGCVAHAVGAASNCASSVEPLSASVELLPPVTASSTASK